MTVVLAISINKIVKLVQVNMTYKVKINGYVVATSMNRDQAIRSFLLQCEATR